jgi:hypothetical protein
MPEFPDIAGKYASPAYFFPVHPLPSQEIMQKKE